MRRKIDCRISVIGLFGGLIALHLLLSVAICGLADMTAAVAAEMDRTDPSSRADVSEQTILRAFFERPDDPNCFVLGGLFVLREDGLELLYQRALLTPYPELQAVVFWATPGTRVSMNFSDRRCAISLHVYQEIMRDGRWIKRPTAKPAEPRATSTDEHISAPTDEARTGTQRSTGSLSDILGRLSPAPSADAKADPSEADRVDIRRAKFADNPATGCPRGEGLFAITRSGLQIVFSEPRAKLPFDVEQGSSDDDKSVTFIFSAATCRLTIRVSKWLEAAVFRRQGSESQQGPVGRTQEGVPSSRSRAPVWLPLAPVQ